MRRRALLAAVGGSALAGCTASAPAICSRPSFSADRLEFESRPFPSVKRWWHSQGAILATEPAHLERFEPPPPLAADGGVELSSDERSFLEATDFDESFVLGVVVGSSGQSSDLLVTHAVAEGERVHCYVCIRRRGRTDDFAPHARLVRVRAHGAWTPEAVRATFTNGTDSTDTVDADGTRAAVAGDHRE